MGAHALLSPSAAHRWLNCTAAPRLESLEPDNTSAYALEGTLAHAYCAKALKQYLSRPTEDEDKEIAELHDQFYSGEMKEHVDFYFSTVIEKYLEAKVKTKDAMLLVETKLDFGTYIPEAFGTADAIIIADGVLDIIDFKYGKGVKVSAVRNPQMMIYALGAHEAFGFEYNVKTVRMTIIQPRLDSVSTDEIEVADLISWAVDELMPKAAEAFKGGAQNPGNWCQFCRCKRSCAALAEKALETAKMGEGYKEGHVTKRLMETLILPNLDLIKKWVEGISEYALEQALAGVRYEGYKVVEGRSIRKITDSLAVRKALSGAGYSEAVFMRPPELVTLTDLEKLCGKKEFAKLCGEWVNKPAGKPTLVPNDDKRPAINSAENDFKDM